MSTQLLFQAIQFRQTVLIQPIQFSVSIDFVCTQLNVKTVPFQTIQFSIIDKTLLGATTPGQSEPGSDASESVFRIPQTSNIIGTSSSDCLVSYPEHSLEESYLSAEMQWVYSTALADWASWVLWHIFPCRLSNAKSCLYKYI